MTFSTPKIRVKRGFPAGQADARNAAWYQVIQKAHSLIIWEGIPLHVVVGCMETVEAVVIAQIQEVPVDIPDKIIGVFFYLIRKKGNGTLFTRVDGSCRWLPEYPPQSRARYLFFRHTFLETRMSLFWENDVLDCLCTDNKRTFPAIFLMTNFGSKM